jgi:hypothetical protein
MPQFTTVSPTHIAGQKPRAWERFRDGRYVAIGWLNDIDLTGKSMEEISDLIRHQEYEGESRRIPGTPIRKPSESCRPLCCSQHSALLFATGVAKNSA